MTVFLKVISVETWDLPCSVASVVSNSLQPSGLIPPCLSVHGIFLVRILEWAAMPSTRGSSQTRDLTQVLLHLRHCMQILYQLSQIQFGKFWTLRIEPINLKLYVNIKNWFNKLRWVGFFSWKPSILLKVWQLYRHREEEEKASYI